MRALRGIRVVVCGTILAAAALAMVFRHFGVPAGYDEVSRALGTSETGATMLALRELARARGLRSEGWRLGPGDLASIPLPAILLLGRRHYAVLQERSGTGDLVLLDPGRGRLVVTAPALYAIWTGEALLFGTPEGGGPWLGRPPQLNPIGRIQP